MQLNSTVELRRRHVLGFRLLIDALANACRLSRWGGGSTVRFPSLPFPPLSLHFHYLPSCPVPYIQVGAMGSALSFPAGGTMPVRRILVHFEVKNNTIFTV